jgi:hypothetical protein
MVLEQLEYLYKNPHYLDYLRYNPRWYKILYHDPEMFSEFIKEANNNLHITKKDTIKDFNKKLSFASSLLQYLAKK